jgi:hypothetical protein
MHEDELEENEIIDELEDTGMRIGYSKAKMDCDAIKYFNRSCTYIYFFIILHFP